MKQGKRRVVEYEEMEEEEIKKGPWKEEEDQVLINHVSKYGPRDWSSIRSKGLLRRTGKSCRLRWVNKLRPHLKTGVKFTAEEERTVIELQAQFGNKWARIATHLTGRTDNDVKNFWSSRQKRLSRILHSSSPSSSAPPPPPPQPPSSTATSQLHSPVFHHIPSFPAPNFTSPPKEQSTAKFPELMYPSFLDEFERSSESAVGPTELTIMPMFFGEGQNCQITPRQESNGEVDLDFIIDDLPPIDMFDPIEPLPSPSEWS